MAASEPRGKVYVDKWISENLRLWDGPKAGELFDLSLTPYWIEVLECLSPDHPCTRVAVRKSAQLGYTTVLIGTFLCWAELHPCNMMLVQPTGGAARDFNSEKLGPAIEKSARMGSIIREQTNTSGKGSTATLKRFPGGIGIICGANSPRDLRSRTVQFALCDETDEWAKDLEGQGSPMGMVDARQISFHETGNYKLLEGSTPRIKGESLIDDAFEAGDQRYYQVPCPHCGTMQILDWDRVNYNEEWPHKAWMECISGNGCVIEHHYLPRIMDPANGARWVPTQPGPGRYPSFAIDALYSRLSNWDRMVAKYLSDKDDPLTLKTWTNLWRGKSYEEKGDAPEWEELQARTDRIAFFDVNTVPRDGLFLTMGVDVQQDRLEAVIVAWGVGKTAHVIARVVLEGDTADVGVWGALTRLWRTEWPLAQGGTRMCEMAAVDAGYRPEMTYTWVRGKQDAPRGEPRAMAVKGINRPTDWVLATAPKKAEFTPHGQSKRATVLRWDYGAHAAKVSLYGRLGLEGPNEAGQFPPGFVHIARGFDDDFFQQLVSEQLATVVKKSGRVEYEWRVKARQRNEVLDCMGMAHAAAINLGLNRITPDGWAELAEERGADAPDKGQLDMLRAVVAPQSPSGKSADETAKAKTNLAQRLAQMGQGKKI